MERLYSLQGLRGIAVLGVVLFHMMSVESKFSGGDILLPPLLDFFSWVSICSLSSAVS